MRHPVKNESGIVLIVVLWILVILVIFVVGMGRRGQVHTALAKYAAGQVRAKYVALSGVQYVLALIARDQEDEETSKFDTLYQCGFILDESSSVDKMFKYIPVAGGHLDIVRSWQAGDGKIAYGMADEDGKLNLNGITGANDQILKFLLVGLKVPEETAETIAASVADWIDADQTVLKDPYGNEATGAESEYPAVKNFPFQNLKELLLVKGMTPEIFAVLKDYVTIYPSTGSLVFNLDTAPELILQSLARSFTGPQTNTDLADADAMVRKIMTYRSGPDQIPGNEDDRVIEGNEMNLNSREDAIMMQMEAYRTRISNFLHFGVRGIDEGTGAVYRAEVVVSRAGKILYWHRM